MSDSSSVIAQTFRRRGDYRLFKCGRKLSAVASKLAASSDNRKSSGVSSGLLKRSRSLRMVETARPVSSAIVSAMKSSEDRASILRRPRMLAGKSFRLSVTIAAAWVLSAAAKTWAILGIGKITGYIKEVPKIHDFSIFERRAHLLDLMRGFFFGGFNRVAALVQHP